MGWGGCWETLSSGRGIVIAPMTSQQLWLSVLDLHKTTSVSTQIWMEEGPIKPQSSLRSYPQLMDPGEGVIS